MKFYLSSYKLGTDINEFIRLLPENRRMAYIPNACDGFGDLVDRTRDHMKMAEFQAIFDEHNLGIQVEFFDLRNYLVDKSTLEDDITQFGILFIQGGNVYLLSKLFGMLGFDKILHKWRNENRDILYAGYSAGVCVLAKNLEGIHLMDDLSIDMYGPLEYDDNGIGILNYLVIPHYQSPGHPETEMADDCLVYMKEHNLPYKLLRDGEVIVIE